MTSDLLFAYGTLMRDFDHPMARLLSANADFLGEAQCGGRLISVLEGGYDLDALADSCALHVGTLLQF